MAACIWGGRVIGPECTNRHPNRGPCDLAPPKAVRDLFCQCAAIVGVGSRLAFTYNPTGADGRPDAGRWTGLMLWLQKVAGEPWTWSIRLEELGLFLEESGWTYVPERVETARKRGVEFFAVATK